MVDKNQAKNTVVREEREVREVTERRTWKHGGQNNVVSASVMA